LLVINNIILLLITLLITFVAPIMIAYAGFLLVVNPFNSEAKSKAKTMFLNLVIGLVIALASWLIVDALMAVIYNPSAFNSTQAGSTFGSRWFEILTSGGQDICHIQQTSTIAGSGGVAPVPPSPSQQCPSCVSLSASGLNCKSTSSCSAAPGLATQLSLLARATGGWRVTEAFPPTVTHSNPCHYNGTCVDVGFTSSYTAQAVADFASEARGVGLRPVFETMDCSLRDAVRLVSSIDAYCVTDSGYSHITGSHFSIYGN
jgi:hypothetical protein